MKPARVLFATLLLLMSSRHARASAPVGYEDLVAKFFDLVSTGKSAEAVDFLYKTNPYSDRIADTIQQVKSSMTSTETQIGSYRGSSLVLHKELGDRVAYLYFVVSYDRQPMKFEFFFYKPADKWVIQNFSFSDKVLDDIREFARYDLAQKLK